MFVWRACSVAIFLLVVAAVSAASVQVDAASAGAVVGSTVGTRNGTAAAFLGIPYAQSTAGARRWSDPLPMDPFDPPFQALSFGPACPQQCILPPATCPVSVSEDCLSLNIWTPFPLPQPASALPVMVFFPGGRFENGGTDTYLYDGRELTQRNVIVVSVNFRLGALGFLYSSDLSISGNFGVRDQRLALIWVQKNIASFGGDPSSVTIFGQSAGGESVAYHLMSQLSQGLFARVILQSIYPTLPFKNAKHGNNLAQRFVSDVGCASAENVLDCLKNVTADQIVAAEKAAEKHFNILDPLLSFLPWTPMVGVGGDSLPAQYFHMFLQGMFNQNVDIMMGTVANESNIFIDFGFSQNISEAKYIGFLGDLFNVKAVKVLHQYPSHLYGSIFHTMSMLANDFIFGGSGRLVANATQNAFVYYFDQVMSFSKQAWGANYTECFNLVCHGEELVYVFGTPYLGSPPMDFTSAELQFSNKIMDMWTNFARQGAPGAGWSRYKESQKVMYLSANTTRMIPYPRSDFLDFWDEIGYRQTQ